MKKILFVCIALSCGFVASAQVSDTVVVRRPDQVVIIKSQDAQSITVRGSEDDPDFVYKSSVGIGSSSNISVVENRPDFLHQDLFNVLSPRSQRSKEQAREWNRSKFRFGDADYLMLGFTCGNKEAEGISVSPRIFSDIDVNLASMSYYPEYKGFAFNFGLDFGYRSVRIAGDNAFAKAGDDVVLVPFAPDATRKTSAVRYFNFACPFMLSYQIGDFRIMAGVEGEFNFAGHIRTKYRLDGEKYKTRTKDIPLNKLTYSYLTILQFDGVGVYFRYTPCNVLDSKHGPEFQTYSVGIVL